MLTRKPIWLAIAAAGLLRAEGLREAYSGDVFVPELAVVDGAICGTAASTFRGPSGILIAQAKNDLHGAQREARVAEQRLARAWFGERSRLDLARL